jgi:hypothetical protein
VSDLPASGAWIAWVVAALVAGWGLWGLYDGRMRFSLPLPQHFTRRERSRYARVVTGNLARVFGLGYIGVGALALVSLKAGAVVAFVLGVAGWVMGSFEDD